MEILDVDSPAKTSDVTRLTLNELAKRGQELELKKEVEK